MKYSSKRINSIPDDVLIIYVQELIFVINVITGWKIPQLTGNPAIDAKVKVLEEQLLLKLKEDYSNLNFDELKYAFRRFGGTVKDWGKDINLSLIDEVLIQYLSERSQVSQIEERLQKPVESPKPTDDQIIMANREMIEVCYQGFLMGKQSFVLMPECGIATLALDEMCEFDLYKDFLEHALRQVQKQISDEIEDLKLRGRIAMVKEKQQELADVGETSETVIRFAKKIALVYFFSEAQKKGLKNIYLKSE